MPLTSAFYRVYQKLQDTAKSTQSNEANETKTKSDVAAKKKGEIQCREKGRRDEDEDTRPNETRTRQRLIAWAKINGMG